MAGGGGEVIKKPADHPLDDAQKKEWQRRAHFSIRINMFFFATFLLFSILIVRLAILQFVEGPELSAQRAHSAKREVTISPIRGNIYDSQGFPIAYSVSAQSLFYRIEPGQKDEDKIELAKKLADIFATYGDPKLAPLSAADIIKRMDVGIDIDGQETKKPGYTFWPRRIKANLTNEEIAYLSEHRDELKGTEIVEESTRRYDESRIAVNLVGYLRPYSVALNQINQKPGSFLDYYKDNPGGEYLNEEYVGFDGLEFMYQEELRGKNGTKTYPVNAKSQIIGQVKITKPEKGHNLYLTIRKEIQEEAEKAIEDHIKFMKSSQARGTYYELGRNAVAGYAVAMEVDSGKVVAMANYPDYDPNMWIGGLSTEDWNKYQILFTNGTIRERQPWILDDKERMKHPSSLVPLGSTIKPLTVLVGLNEGLITPSTPYQDPTTFYFGRDSHKVGVSNSDKHNYGTLYPWSAIKFSSNTFMAEMIGNRLYMSSKYPPYDSKNPGNGNAIEVWDSYMKKFGLGVTTGSGLPGESSGTIEYFNSAKRDSPQSALIYASFGQQGRYTVLQLAQYASMLANHGKRYKPLFVEKITTYNDELVRVIDKELLNEEKFPDEYWKVLEQGMSQVNVQGFDGVAYSFNRKTGTSQQDVAGQTLENGVFIAYAPADKPKLAIAVVVPEGGFGSWSAAPIARKIFDAYDKYVGLYGTPRSETAAAE